MTISRVSVRLLTMAILLPSKKSIDQEQTLPLIPIRNLVPFPDVEIQLIFGRPKSTAALLHASNKDKLVMVVAQKDHQVDDPQPEDLYEFGVICRIEHVVQIDGTVHALFKGLRRARIKEFLSQKEFFQVKVVPLPEIVEQEEEIKVLADHLSREVKKALSLGKIFDPSILMRLNSGVSATELANWIAFSLDASVAEKQAILENLSLKSQLKQIIEKLAHEINVLQLEKSIERKTKAKFEKQMKRAVLEERKRAIEKELEKMGAKLEPADEIKELEKKLKAAKMPVEVRKKAKYELGRLAKMSPLAPEASYIRTYLEWLADMPWQKRTPNNVSFRKAASILNKDHYGLKQIKERILEYLAVMKLRQKRKKTKGETDGETNILCFIGPPGVGKTSIGRSIARALGRKFIRVSLGGVRDEAEIRGHRRTYVGALPGRIIQGIKNAGVKNPVFMLDEIDKLGADFRGDPSAALLEALDPEQNKEFSDHYLEVPFDLSEVFFILTGNVVDTIPPALLDRLEVIRFSGYTEEEKFHIAKKYLIPKQLLRHGLKKKEIEFTDEAIREIIRKYTREAGVRELERMVAGICRKIARKIAEKKKFDSKITPKTVGQLLGSRKFSHQLKGRKDEIGVATGLAWTQSGGEILFIEVALMPGKGKLILTGKLGDVMKESCRAALSYIRSHWKELGLSDKDFAQKLDFHIHIPEGAVPKDGPSAGITIATALVSALKKVPVKRDVGMTGEITLRGRILAIGGVKEKVLAAHRAGIKKVILPKENRKDLREIPVKIRRELEFVFVDHLDQVFKEALKVA